MILSALFSDKTKMVQEHDALKGRVQAIPTAQSHFVNNRPLHGPFPKHLEVIYVGMGCFWGAERLFWQLEGVHVTAVGYQGGYTLNPTYEETVTGKTGHAETVMIVFEPQKITLEQILKVFFEEHDPTQGMRQGNDIGTTYRSAIFTTSQAQLTTTQTIKVAYQAALSARGMDDLITTEIRMAPEFYYAETYHQQYLAKNPHGYCGLQGTGVSCPLS